MSSRVIMVQDIPITVTSSDLNDYICITDIAGAKSEQSRAADVIRNWLRNRTTLEFLSTWEQIYNPNFKVFESEHFKKQAGLLTFTPSVSEWIEQTNAIGLFVKKGRFGGTFAHKDIAFEFASAISPVFKLYLIKEFQRLKEDKQHYSKFFSPHLDISKNTGSSSFPFSVREYSTWGGISLNCSRCTIPRFSKSRSVLVSMVLVMAG